MTLALYQGEAFFNDGWKRVKYRFDSEEAERAFITITNRVIKPFIDYDLFHHIKRMYPNLYLKQDDLKSRCAYSPEMLRKHCKIWEKQATTGNLNYDSVALSKAYSRARARFAIEGKVKPIAFDEVEWINDTNFGAPYFKNSKDIEDAQEKAIAGAKAIARGRSFYPFACYHRGKSDEEARIIFAEGKSEWLVGAKFFYPYFEALKNTEHCPYAGVSKRQGVSARMNKLKWDCRFALAMDYSKYDATIPRLLIRLAFKIIRENLELTEKEEVLFWRYVDHFCSNGIIMPDGYIYYGRKGGVPSGSVFTSLIDSIVNAILIEYVAIRSGVMTTDYIVLGDDSVTGLVGLISKEEVASIIGDFNVVISVEDTEVLMTRSQNLYFLGHFWEYGSPRRGIEETVSRLVCPEFPRGWNYAEYGSLEYIAGLFDKIKDYQNDNEWFWTMGNEIIDSFLYPSEPHLWGKVYHKDFYLTNMRCEDRKGRIRPSGLERAFGTKVVDPASWRTVAL